LHFNTKETLFYNPTYGFATMFCISMKMIEDPAKLKTSSSMEWIPKPQLVRDVIDEAR